ncbi:Spy/CpxP family protein refolding chaperone [Povalibacter uvarum]|uniref:Spy/CpxP family protein refolding chaperone n=1 Tax=Povalibacter uvarum TaxID=732238 RepID=A0A841HVD6_9GAMM|nr:hypothetical protein [Povalibacter uvarum]MBB6095922.1 Spy/CpxP family protein refolding chaperone [Povalibacter uvarum]
MKRLSVLVAALAASVLCLSMSISLADSSAPAEMTIEQLKSRLNLSAEQQAKIAPYVETRKAKLQEAHGKISSSSSRKDKRAALQEAKQAQDEFVKNVEPVLTAEQQAEWQKMRAEAREQMKERLKNR